MHYSKFFTRVLSFSLVFAHVSGFASESSGWSKQREARYYYAKGFPYSAPFTSFFLVKSNARKQKISVQQIAHFSSPQTAHISTFSWSSHLGHHFATCPRSASFLVISNNRGIVIKKMKKELIKPCALILSRPFNASLPSRNPVAKLSEREYLDFISFVVFFTKDNFGSSLSASSITGS